MCCVIGKCYYYTTCWHSHLAECWKTEKWGLGSKQWQTIRLSSYVSRSILVPTQCFIQCAQRAISPVVKRPIISLRSIFKCKEKFIFPLVGRQTWLDAFSIPDALSGLKCCGTAGRDTWTEVGNRYLDLKAICHVRTSIFFKECQSWGIYRSNAKVYLGGGRGKKNLP